MENQRKILLLKKPYQTLNYNLTHQKNGMIPTGLWYIFEEYWKQWSENNKLNINYLYSITVEESHIYKIYSIQDLKKFNEKFLIKDKIVDWQKVALYFDGIEVNFKYEKNDSWISDNVWKKPTGCIWDKEAILSIHKITVEETNV